jgi:ribosome maturation factor RimP
MDVESLKARLEELVDPLIKDNFMELADLEVVGGGSIFRFYVDKAAGGITLDECAVFSRQASAMIDASGLVPPGEYELEVSSPGINRPLKKREAFEKYAGKNVSVVTRDLINNSRHHIGRLNGINGDMISMTVNGNDIQIDFNNIKKANLEELT